MCRKCQGVIGSTQFLSTQFLRLGGQREDKHAGVHGHQKEQKLPSACSQWEQEVCPIVDVSLRISAQLLVSVWGGGGIMHYNWCHLHVCNYWFR